MILILDQCCCLEMLDGVLLIELLDVALHSKC